SAGPRVTIGSAARAVLEQAACSVCRAQRVTRSTATTIGTASVAVPITALVSVGDVGAPALLDPAGLPEDDGGGPGARRVARAAIRVALVAAGSRVPGRDDEHQLRPRRADTGSPTA